MRNSARMAAVMAACTLAGAPAARGEVLLGPRVGYYKTMDADEGSFYGGGALRVMLLPGLGAELAADYHAEDSVNEMLNIRTIPVTASAIIRIFPAVYLAGGVGWYHTRYAFDEEAEALGFEDETVRDFGYQFGGGLSLGGDSLGGPRLVVDGRWHVLNEKEFENQVKDLSIDKVDPDFWSVNAGLMFRFQ